jgi:ABC-type multidrug transport system ATPase subunit
VCDRVGIFASGRLIGQGTVDELAARFGDETAIVDVDLEAGPGETLDANLVEEQLRAIDNVQSVRQPERPGRPWKVVVSPAGASRAVRQAILAAGGSGLPLAGLHLETPALDDIYRAALRRRAEAKGKRTKPTRRMRRTEA